jgi:solute:Na+ symporter, SSS family
MVFFGALLSAILSTTSGAILAPASILSENLIKPLRKKMWSEKHHLLMVRFSVLVVAIISLAMALWRGNIYELVAESSAISLVSLFVPLVGGLWWKKAKPLGAILSMILGFVSWLVWEYLAIDYPSIIVGLALSFIGMILGSYFKK